MKKEFIDIPLIKNDQKKRFEIEIDGFYAFINFGEVNNVIALVHTEADPELKGRGAANAVVEKTLNYLKDNKMSLMPYCPFVFAYIKRHPEWKAIVNKKFPGYDQL